MCLYEYVCGRAGKACLEVVAKQALLLLGAGEGGGHGSAVFGTSQRSLLSFRIEIGFVLRLVGRVQ